MNLAVTNEHFFDSVEHPDYFLMILKGQRRGNSALPNLLGLDTKEFYSLLSARAAITSIHCSADSNTKADIREELLSLREDEWQELVDLLLAHAKDTALETKCLAKILAAGCMGSHHLWQDLGLPDRKSLSDLISYAFPALALKNNKNMRWKKFFYRQLCEEGGHFICRSPSCETCPTYNECFGDEI